MNFVFISPNYPSGHWKYVAALRSAGACVLCIGDAGYETFSPVLRGNMTEYYRVGDLHDYESVYRAMGYFIHKYGRISHVESLNPYWRDLEAMLRNDFRIDGVSSDRLRNIFDRKKMFDTAEKAGVKTAAHSILTSISGAKRFAAEFVYPVIARPVSNKRLTVFVLDDENQLVGELKGRKKDGYILLSQHQGEYVSCDGMADAENNALVCTASHFAEYPARTAEKGNLLAFTTERCSDELSAKVKDLLKVFNMGADFFHFDFIKLSEDISGIGNKGEYVLSGVEFNSPAWYVADSMCCALGCNVYDIWAKIKLGQSVEIERTADICACFASRRFDKTYKNSHENILRRFGTKIYSHEKPSEWDKAAGDYCYIIACGSASEAVRAVRYIQEDHALPGIPEKSEPGRAVSKTDILLKKASE